MIDPIVFLAPQVAKNCGQGTCRVGPAYCCQRLTKRHQLSAQGTQLWAFLHVRTMIKRRT